MGKLEDKSRKRHRSRNIQNFILTAIAVSVGLSSPYFVQRILQELRKNNLSKPPTIGSIYNARKRLIKMGLIFYKNGFLRLTSRGQSKIAELEKNNYHIVTPKRWDKKWRVIIFDVSEKRKALREKIRRTFQTVGFTRLQDSVWVYPYPCEDLVALLKTDFKIGKELLYMIVEEIENDRWLQEHFELI